MNPEEAKKIKKEDVILKDCPFCGNEPNHLSDGSRFAPSETHYIKCTCGASIYGRDWRIAIKCWNKRIKEHNDPKNKNKK